MATSAARMSGIDVSHFQQEIDWHQVHTVGIAFAFIKATDGTTVADRRFAIHWRQSKAARVLRGAYHFFRPQLDPEAQAKFFLERLNEDYGELPPVLDVESLSTGISSEQVIAGAKRWIDFISAVIHRKAILYTGSAFWRNTLRNSTALADCPLWVAHYTSGPNPLVPSAWPKWTFWQFSQRGKMAGIEGFVDLDVFNGTAAELEAFCMSPSPTLKPVAV